MQLFSITGEQQENLIPGETDHQRETADGYNKENVYITTSIKTGLDAT